MATLDFFRNTHIDNTTFFDEGPRVPNAKPLTSGINTGSIDTFAIDGFRQGVEITHQKYFDVGYVKIHAGEPGHRLRANTFGMVNNIRNVQPFFKDADYFDPVSYIKAQAINSSSISFPIITSNDDEIENRSFNGIIEPFTIRARVSFFSREAPFESHEVKGALMNGNTNQAWESDQILTVDRYDLTQKVFYLDMVDVHQGRTPMNGFFSSKKATLLPFVDERLIRDTKSTSVYATDMSAAMSLMSGSTGNYISIGYRSGAAGKDYDNNMSIGTDSIAFGGMVY
jgi:hypothetical protein